MADPEHDADDGQRSQRVSLTHLQEKATARRPVVIDAAWRGSLTAERLTSTEHSGEDDEVITLVKPISRVWPPLGQEDARCCAAAASAARDRRRGLSGKVSSKGHILHASAWLSLQALPGDFVIGSPSDVKHTFTAFLELLQAEWSEIELLDTDCSRLKALVFHQDFIPLKVQATVHSWTVPDSPCRSMVVVKDLGRTDVVRFHELCRASWRSWSGLILTAMAHVDCLAALAVHLCRRLPQTSMMTSLMMMKTT